MTTPPGNSEWTPRPDPTLLTTQQLLRELSSLRELFENKLDGVDATLTTRLDGMDIATRLLSETVNRTPTEIQTQIAHLRELMEEKFESVDKQFVERDTRTDQAAKASKEALDAALLAAKELVSQQNEANAQAADKAEQSTIKQIDQIGIRIDTTQKGLEDRLTELKERVDRGEGSSSGSALAVTDARQTKTLANSSAVLFVMGLSIMVSIIAIVVSLVVHIH